MSPKKAILNLKKLFYYTVCKRNSTGKLKYIQFAGNAMGYLAMVLGLSGAQALAIVVLGFISAWGNPCIMLGLWITGTVSKLL